jgi:DNA-3-methyladenine glycosylase II
MAQVVISVGKLRTYYRERTDLQTVCRIITGQQLSYRAASTIWARLQALCPSWGPKAVAGLSQDRLRGCGLSRGKAAYIHEAAARVVAGTLNFTLIRRMTDEDAAQALRSIKGFGPWSVEMFMIFSLERPDVFSVGDAGLRRAICTLYRVPKASYEHRVEKITDRWRPWRSYACRYLWAWLDNQG